MPRLTPLEIVLQQYKLPSFIKEVHPLQAEAVNGIGVLNNGGLFLDMGLGKTLVSTLICLYLKITQGRQAVVVMPPVLIAQWGRWLRSLKPDLRVTEYKGTPSQRAKLSLDCDFFLVGAQIFKKDYNRISAYFADHPHSVVIDEATIVSNNESKTHKLLYEFSIGCPTFPMTGTPMNKVMDAYGIMKFSAPGIYRNRLHFENMHVEERDFFDMPSKFMQLDVLAKNLATNSTRMLYSDMYPDTEDPLMVPILYELEPEHYKLYRQLAEEQLLALPDGSKIDATSANALRHALGQIIINWGHFAGDPTKVSGAVDLIKEKLEELGDKKLVVFCDYKLTAAKLQEDLGEYGAVLINGTVTPSRKETNIQTFLTDPKCRVIVIQFVSGGKGLDGLQHVCHHAMFIEPCLQPRDFWQCVGRLQRTGQKFKVLVMLATAKGTTQVRGFKVLLDNDALVNQVVRNKADLRNMVFGL